MIPQKDKVLQRSLQRLEFRQILAFLADHARSEPGRSAALSLAPSQSLEKVRTDLGLLREMTDLNISGQSLPLGFFSELSGRFENAKLGSTLSAQDLLEILRMLEQAESTRRFLHAVREKFPGLAGVGDRVQNFSALKSRLERTVDEHGELKNSASARLAELRSEFGVLRGRIQKALERLLSSRSLEDALQDNFYTEREGRFVIPVRSSAQSSINGIVHDTSASGATVFIEPIEMVPQNNRLRVIEKEILAEIMRILEELTREIAGQYDALSLALEALTELDLIQAKAALAQKLGASIPVTEQGPALALYKIRHPLLVLKGTDAVANDIVLDPQTRALVISGPNTGGKTVFMKTVGILALMVRAGMAIPAHPDSRIGFFSEVYAEIGDDQSLAQDLSSYSAHVLALIAFLAYAGNGALVLVDEILGSTDPEEGSALAISILRELARRGCVIAVTTHNSRLKAFAESEPMFKNASFEFDPQTLTPTYHLRVGVPGPSYGIATAQKLGLKPELVAEAQDMLEPEARRIMELVEQLDRKQAELDQGLRALATREQETESLQEQVEERSAQLSAREKSLKRDVRRELESELQSMRLRFRQLFERAQETPSRETRAEAEKEISQMRGEVEEKYPEPEMGEEVAEGEWEAGDLAWVSKLRVRAELVEIDRAEGEATLVVGSIRLKEKFSGLRLIRSGDMPVAPEERGEEPVAEREISPVQSKSNTLDLRGKRAEDAEMDLINYLDRMAREGVPAVFIIHGHGTGVLKKLVRDYLAGSSYVTSFRPGEQGEGGDGVTVAFLERMKK